MLTASGTKRPPNGARRVRSEWTPRQVAEALWGYTQMGADASVGYLRGTSDAEEGRGSIYVPGAPIEMLAARKCDIELAISHVGMCHDLNWCKALTLYFLRGFGDSRHCAPRLGVHQTTAARWVRSGVREVAIFLCGYTAAGEEIMEHI